MRVTVSTKRISRNLYTCDLRLGQFHDLPIISQWEKLHLPLFAIHLTQYVPKNQAAIED